MRVTMMIIVIVLFYSLNTTKAFAKIQVTNRLGFEIGFWFYGFY